MSAAPACRKNSGLVVGCGPPKMVKRPISFFAIRPSSRARRAFGVSDEMPTTSAHSMPSRRVDISSIESSSRRTS
jgi:hypothetical protein